MKKERIATKGISLVVLLLIATRAHGHFAARSVPNAITDNVKDTADDAKDSIASKSQSLVQDWSLVCEQLCRAGLGGPSCGPPCDEISESYKGHRAETARYLLSNKKDSICNFLCSNGLGEPSCGCRGSRSKHSFNLDRDTICNIFCKASNITILGCSPCKNIIASTKSSARTTLLTSSTATTKITKTTGNHNDIISVPQLSLSIGGDADENESTSTTPNWNEYCLSLCKIGEGGSLCNCDLPPFF